MLNRVKRPSFWLFQNSHLKDVETIAVQQDYRKTHKLGGKPLANPLGNQLVLMTVSNNRV